MYLNNGLGGGHTQASEVAILISLRLAAKVPVGPSTVRSPPQLGHPERCVEGLSTWRMFANTIGVCYSTADSAARPLANYKGAPTFIHDFHLGILQHLAAR